jgi:hypothetical protein
MKQRAKILLKAFCVIVLFLSFLTSNIKEHNWWEDGHGPYPRTSAWIPHRRYSPDVEQALTILQCVERDQVLYLRSRGNPINFVPGSRGRRGATTERGEIELPERFRGNPTAIAVILSHEIFHLQRHDPIVVPREYPLWRRILWHDEEEAAHWKGFWTAVRLSCRYPSVWQVLGVQWLLEPPFFFIVGPQSILAGLALLFLYAREIRRGRRQKTAA